MDKVEKFKDLIDHYEYKKAAKMYYDLAYMYQGEFNKILNENNVKDKVIDIMYELCGNDHIDQI